MDENLHDTTDRLFQEGLHKFKSDPSDKVWNKIEKELDEEDRKPGWLIFGWKRYAATAVMLLAGAGIAFIIYSPRQTSLSHEVVLRDRAKGIILSKSPDTKQKDPDLYKSQNTPATGISSEQNSEAKYLLQTDPDFIPLHLFSTPDAEPHTQSLSITAPVIRVDNGKDSLEIKGSPVSLIHQKPRFRDRLSLTPYFSKEFAGYNVVDNNDMTGPNGQEIEERERNVFSASVGLYVNLKISKRWVLQSGISYSWSSSNIDSATSYAVKDNQGNIQFKLNTISGYGYLRPSSSIQPNVGDSVLTAKSYSQLHYLTIPLIISWRVPMKRFSLLIGAGASVNVLTSAEIETKTYGNGNPEKEYEVNMMGLKKINYGVMVKLDLEYRLNSNFGVNIIPCFKNTLSPINLKTPVAAYPYNFGIGAGITYRF